MIVQESEYKGTDLKAVVNYTYLTSGLVVKSNAPWNTLQEFWDYVKTNPGKVSVALGGEGSTSDINSRALFNLLGLEVIPVQYSGSGPAVVAVAGGHVDASIASDGSIVPLLADGTVKVLASFGPARTLGFPDAPTLLESGIDYSSSSAHAFWCKPDVPQERVDKLEELFMQTMKDERLLDTAAKIELAVIPEGSASATEKLYKEWEELVEFFK
jgi:tripartite-type tricarboxylate transporter receptor subunit TctC